MSTGQAYTPSERAVRPRLDEIFAQTKKKLFLQLLLVVDSSHSRSDGVAHAHGRQGSHIIGRSLDNSTEIAQDLGYLDLPQGLVINPGQIKELPAHKVCVMITGTRASR